MGAARTSPPPGCQCSHALRAVGTDPLERCEPCSPVVLLEPDPARIVPWHRLGIPALAPRSRHGPLCADRPADPRRLHHAVPRDHRGIEHRSHLFHRGSALRVPGLGHASPRLHRHRDHDDRLRRDHRPRLPRVHGTQRLPLGHHRLDPRNIGLHAHRVLARTVVDLAGGHASGTRSSLRPTASLGVAHRDGRRRRHPGSRIDLRGRLVVAVLQGAHVGEQRRHCQRIHPHSGQRNPAPKRDGR